MKIFSILKKDMLLLLRNRAEMAVLFLLPLAFILPISFALGKGDGYGLNRNNHMTQLPVANYDQGRHAQALLSAIGESLQLEYGYQANELRSLGLAGDPDCALDTPESRSGAVCDEKAARTRLLRSQRSAALIIPTGFSDAIDAGQPVKASLIYDPGGDAISMQQIEGVVKGATIKISVEKQVNNGFGQLNDLAALAPANIRESVAQNSGQTTAASFSSPAIQIEQTLPANYPSRAEPDTYQQTIPGYTVMYVFFIIATLAGSIREERLNGTLRRLLTTPASRSELLGGKLLSTMIIGLAQVIILFGVGALLFKLNLGSDPLAFLLLTLALIATATAIGLALTTFSVKGGALTGLLIISALLGGCMFPLDLMPPILRTLSYLTPHSWALTGYQNLMVRGQGLTEVLPQILVLLAFAVVFFLIAVRRFDFQSQEVD